MLRCRQCNGAVKGAGAKGRQLGWDPAAPLASYCSWASVSTSLWLGYLTCKTRVVIVTARPSQGYCSKRVGTWEAHPKNWKSDRYHRCYSPRQSERSSGPAGWLPENPGGPLGPPLSASLTFLRGECTPSRPAGLVG